MDKVDRFQEGEATQLPFGRLTPITYLPFLLSKAKPAPTISLFFATSPMVPPAFTNKTFCAIKHIHRNAPEIICKKK